MNAPLNLPILPQFLVGQTLYHIEEEEDFILTVSEQGFVFL